MQGLCASRLLVPIGTCTLYEYDQQPTTNKETQNYNIKDRIHPMKIDAMDGSLFSFIPHSSMMLKFLLLISIACTMTNGQDCAANGVCDTHARCPVWKEEGECTMSASYMKKHCPVSCGYGKVLSLSDRELTEKSVQFGVKQVAEGKNKEESLEIISKSIEYMKEPRDTTRCKNQHEFCSFWATVGTCIDVLLSLKRPVTNSGQYCDVP